ncbi:hypothetical protein HUR95_00475 [Caldalkalibacillus thermarum TA2.A1]|uniref:Uncharacterized protein n=1 Tax=Caldalkalibacillus thermarum (strain TA2.A1) TaxID=986075 RepID=A0A8X8I422_CALTT|nr:hypothetical protein [Caldalkalibacillus thermarum]QZT33951.1 hypothetical protein HUR95_00475 [Caldalkalibacillus thermarum TA2.A1]
MMGNKRILRAIGIIVLIYIGLGVFHFVLSFLMEHLLLSALLIAGIIFLWQSNQKKFPWTRYLKLKWFQSREVMEQLLRQLGQESERVLDLLREKQDQISFYLAERKAIIHQLRAKEAQIDMLQQQISQLEADGSREKLEQLMQQLNEKLNEIKALNRRLAEVSALLEEQRRKADQLEQSRTILKEERNQLLEKYRKFRQLHKQKEEENRELGQTIQRLKKQVQQYEAALEQAVSPAERDRLQRELERVQAELKEREEARTALEQEKQRLANRLEAIEQQHKETASQLAELEKELEQLRKEKDHGEKQRLALMEKLDSQQNQLESMQYILQEERHKYLEAKKEREALQVRLIQTQQEYDQKKKEYEEKEQVLFELGQEYEQEIQDLRAQLIDSKNQYALLEAEKGAPLAPLQLPDKKVLEKEFKPRFEKLYPKFYFYPEFFHDFINLNVTERIKVEAKIAQMYYNPQVLSNIRPNTVDTPLGTVTEFPFSKKGRIYFKWQEHEGYICSMIRLSRTEREQKRVIAWLQQRLKQAN